MPQVVLIAKPWQGGLAHYLFETLRALLRHDVEWVPTYPRTWQESLAYRRDRRGWRDRLVEQVNRTDHAATIAVNLPYSQVPLTRPERNVLWLTDSARGTAEDFASFSRVYLTDPGYAAATVTAAGSRFAGELPFAHLPTVHRPATNASPPTRDVVFIGSRDAARDRWIRWLVNRPWRSTIVGNYWPKHPLAWRYPLRFRRRVARAAMGRVYARHRVSLNFMAAVVRESTNMRTFECCGYEIPQAVEYRPGLQRWFDLEKELPTFRTEAEATEQVERLLQDRAAARAIARAARARACAEHTYERRLHTLLNGLVDLPQ